VPVMEELFWRSYLMRWIDQHDFLALAPAAISLKAILVSGLVFGLAHHLWFAGILAGLERHEEDIDPDPGAIATRARVARDPKKAERHHDSRLQGKQLLRPAQPRARYST